MIYLPGCISRRQLLDGVRETFQFAGFGIRQNSETRIFYYCDWEKGTAHIQRNLNALGMFGPPKTEAGNRVITLLEPALEALKAQRKLTALQPKTEIVFNHREYGAVENQSLRFVFIPRMRKGEQKAWQNTHYGLSIIFNIIF